MSNASDFLIAKALNLTYGDGDNVSVAVNNVSLELPPTGYVGIMGPSGSGKSSLLYILSGLKRPTSGNVSFGNMEYSNADNRALAELRRQKFGFVFQQPFMLNYLTARENVMTAALDSDPHAMDRCTEILTSLGVNGLADKFPYQLSGGERQRICVARAMINSPVVIFADEPTAALDHKNGHIVIDELSSYRERGLVVVVTHDPEMVNEADYVHRMRDGRLED